MSKKSHQFFLLTHGYRDYRGHIRIVLHAKRDDGVAARIMIDTFEPVFFVPRDTPTDFTRRIRRRKPLELKSLTGQVVDCCYFAAQSDLVECARELREKGYRTFESDIHPVERFLMERLVKGVFTASGPFTMENGIAAYHNPVIRWGEGDFDLSVLSLDIETNADTNEIYSIACCDSKNGVVFMSGEGPAVADTEYCGTEKETLKRFLSYVARKDPDILIGWNVVDFDLMIIQQRCEKYGAAFNLGRDFGARILPPSSDGGKSTARIPGRVVMDVPTILRNYHGSFEQYSLDYVASKVLGTHKLITTTGQNKIDEIKRQFSEDKPHLAKYNLEDTRLTLSVFEKLNVLPDAIARSKLSGHLLDRTGGSVAAFDYLYLPLLHRKGYVASNVDDVAAPTSHLPGGYVMDSQAGVYENMLVLDFKSLYPTIIMTFKIDPLGRAAVGDNPVKGPVGPAFSRDTTILPEIIAKLMTARAEAKRTRNLPLSQAIKIIMNSFYGVLGANGCRFFSAELASTITGIGQYMLKTTVAHIEKTTHHKVIYGDTDSLFLLLGPGYETQAHEIGGAIVKNVNEWLSNHIHEKFNTESALELEFETHFRHFFMPTIRGSTQGSKKRYCGAIEKDGELSLTFKGLESARTDWTALAKELQHNLLMRLFTGQEVRDYIIETVRAVRNGEHDQKLIYKKGLRKKLSEYTDHAPPHVQAARMLDGRQPSRIAYVITTEGPQPLEKQTAPLDYEHYVEAQLAPVANSIIEWLGLDFDNLVSGQQDLFG